jgi:cytochrome c2
MKPDASYDDSRAEEALALLDDELDRCPDCVEGLTNDVQDGEPVVETCALCHGTGTQ